MKGVFVVILFLFFTGLYAQQDTIPEVWREEYKKSEASGDTLNQLERMKAQRARSENALRELKESGSIIVRLKTNDKSVDAYRKAGKNEIADRMVKERKVMNQKIYDAFSRIVTFCPVHFIYAKDTRELIAGKEGLFLNADLEYDKNIVLKDTFFVIVEQGNAQTNAFVQDNSHAPVMGHGNDRKFMGSDKVDGYNSSSASEGSLVFIDKGLKQYLDPFPFCEGVYIENYNAAAMAINKQLFRAYNRLVTMPDMRKEIKKAKEETREKMRGIQ